MHGGADAERAQLGGGGGGERRGEAGGPRARGEHAAVRGERGREVGGAVVGADERVPEERVGAEGGRKGERGEPGAPRGGVGGDELGGDVGAGGEARGDGERVDAEELGQRRGRGRREEAGEDGERGRGLWRRHLIARSKWSFGRAYTRSAAVCVHFIRIQKRVAWIQKRLRFKRNNG